MYIPGHHSTCIRFSKILTGRLFRRWLRSLLRKEQAEEWRGLDCKAWQGEHHDFLASQGRDKINQALRGIAARAAQNKMIGSREYSVAVSYCSDEYMPVELRPE